MSPPCYTFPASELPERVQLDVHGRQRKMAGLAVSAHATLSSGKTAEANSTAAAAAAAATAATAATATTTTAANRHRTIDLARDCALLTSLVQYSCSVPQPDRHNSPIHCWPVQRLFRRCQDRSGAFMVETTAWEQQQQQQQQHAASAVEDADSGSQAAA